MRMAYSRCSLPSAELLAEEGGFELVRRSRQPVLVNWGREWANASLNPNISNTTNKRVMRELFKQHGVPMPELISVRGGIFPHDEDGILAKPLVGRPDKHTKGRGFWKCYGVADVQRALRGTRRKRAATHFMEFVDAPREYRVHIFKGMSIRISEKDFFMENGKRTYTTIKPQHRIAHVRRAAKQAVAAVGLDFGAVDILADDENCWVLEVNASPGLGGSLPRLYAEMFKNYERSD